MNRLRAPVRVTHDKQKVTHPTIAMQVGHNAHAFIHNGRIVQKVQATKAKADSAQKVSAVRYKTTNVHNAVTNLTKEVITASKGDTIAVVAIVDHNKGGIAHVSTTMVANNKEVTSPAHKVIMHVLNNKAIVLATMQMAKSSKEATNLVNNKVMDAHNKGAINLAADTQTTVTTTTMVAVIPNKVDITIATIIIIMEATITTHNRTSTTTATLRTIAQAMTPMRNTA